MTRLKQLGGLAQLGRCTSPGATHATADIAALPGCGPHGAWRWSASPLGALVPRAPAPWCRHNSTFAATAHVLDPDSLSNNSASAAAATAPTTTATAMTSEGSPLCSSQAHPSEPSLDSSASLHSNTGDLLLPSAAAHQPSLDNLPLPLPFPLAAHSSLEDSLALVLSPTQLGVQVWEGAHAASGLPWWAAIPAATLALRCALLPLSLRAYASSSNVALVHQAFGLSRGVAEAVLAAQQQKLKLRKQREEEEEAAAAARRGEEKGDGAAGREAPASSSSASSSSGGAAAAAAGVRQELGGRELGRMELVRRVLAHLRAQHGAPGFGWYLGNAAVQVPLAVCLTLALRRMSDSLWPGLTTEGLLYFKDLTAQPVYLHTLSTPFGTAGAMLPLALVLVYLSATDRSAGGTSPGIQMALKLLTVPLYCAALLQPHAVLLYWLAHVATQMGVYTLAARLPGLRRAAGIPDHLVTPRGAAGQGHSEVSLDHTLLALSESYGKSGNTAAARTCLQALLARQPGHEAAMKRLQELTEGP